MTEDKELALIFPPEKSMSGRNSVYQFCDARQQQVSYAVCLHTIKKIEDGTMPKDQFIECQRGYTHNNCPAKKMRKQEIAAGQALFFIERPRHITDPVAKEANTSNGAVSSGKYDMNNPSYARGWAIGGGSGVNTAAPKKQQPKPTRNVGPIKKTGFVEATMADALNEMVKDDKKPKAVEQPKPVAAKAAPAPVAAAQPSTSNRPLPGESMADFIKRRAQQGKKQ
ncbi:MAG: hypothetical protein RR818_00585 [Citrobacter sp.]